jgi:cell division protein FtsB
MRFDSKTASHDPVNLEAMALTRKKPKKKLTQLQENRLLKTVVVLISAAVLWLLFAPGTGVYSLIKMRSRTAALEQQTEELTRSNEALKAEIERLKHDEAYLEQVAREKYGLLKKNERVFDFSNKSETD